MDKNILVIEDSLTQALKTKIILEDNGYNVTIAENGKKALELIKNKHFPIVLTDWIMPKMTGIEFCQIVREELSEKYIYIILLTTKGYTSDAIEALESGADDFLVKPVDKGELLARIKAGERIINLERKLKSKTDEIRRIAILDELTNLYNHRYLIEALPDEIKRSKRYNLPLSLIMGDIDHFKRVNDEYGHLAGNEVLKSVAESISESLRKDIDWAARYGGEEFMVVLPQTDFEGAMTVAEKIRKIIEEKIIEYEDKTIKITISFGVASGSPSKDIAELNLNSLISIADKNLYKAKNQGRNQSFGEMI